MPKKPVTKDFSAVLYRLSIVSTLLRLIAVPAGLIGARLLSDVVLAATAGDFKSVLQKGIVIILLVMAVNIFDAIAKTAYQNSRFNAVHQCRIRMYRHFFLNPLHVLYRSSAGEANVILNEDFKTVTDKITESYPAMISSCVMISVYFTFLCVQSPLIACILLGISLLQMIPPLAFKGAYEKYDEDDKNMEKQVADCVFEFYNGFSEIKIFRLQDWMLGRLKYLHDKWQAIANHLQAAYRTETAVTEMIDKLLTYGTYAIIGLLILAGRAGTDVGIEAIALSGGLYASVKSAFQFVKESGVAGIAEKRMRAYWSDSGCRDELISTGSEIKFTNVCCTLDEKTIFSNLNLRLPLTGISIFKGENGAGKSTLIRLALGMAEFQSGEISICGVNPERISYDNFPDKIFYLPQVDAEYHFAASDLYQMLLDKNKIEKAEWLFSCFETDKEAYKRNINELSGGERKKIFLSLALAIDPEILILDEPTNSLDKKSRAVFYDILKDRTKPTVLITHDEELAAIASAVYEVAEGGVTVEK